MRKTVTFAVIINALQAGMMLFLLIYLPSNFQIHSIVLLTTVAMLYITFLGLA